jgi:hypothetical protein
MRYTSPFRPTDDADESVEVACPGFDRPLEVFVWKPWPAQSFKPVECREMHLAFRIPATLGFDKSPRSNGLDGRGLNLCQIRSLDG